MSTGTLWLTLILVGMGTFLERFSFIFLFADRLEACRDPWGFRPLVIGQPRDGFYCIASETCALSSLRRDCHHRSHGDQAHKPLFHRISGEAQPLCV